MNNIPEHKNCKNCGECCGPVPISWKEEKNIEKYLRRNPNIILKLKKQFRLPLDCQFRDTEAKNCAIYQVRPLICKLFGVVKGMECKYGNSDCIDGFKYVDIKEPRKVMKKFY